MKKVPDNLYIRKDQQPQGLVFDMYIVSSSPISLGEVKYTNTETLIKKIEKMRKSTAFFSTVGEFKAHDQALNDVLEMLE